MVQKNTRSRLHWSFLLLCLRPANCKEWLLHSANWQLNYHKSLINEVCHCEVCHEVWLNILWECTKIVIRGTTLGFIFLCEWRENPISWQSHCKLIPLWCAKGDLNGWPTMDICVVVQASRSHPLSWHSRMEGRGKRGKRTVWILTLDELQLILLRATLSCENPLCSEMAEQSTLSKPLHFHSGTSEARDCEMREMCDFVTFLQNK